MSDLDRKELVRSIEALVRDVDMAFTPDRFDPFGRRHVVGRRCPKPRYVRVATLRRLHTALLAFYAEAHADEDAKL